MKKYFIFGLLLSLAAAPCAQAQSSNAGPVVEEPAADSASIAPAPAPAPAPSKSKAKPIYFGATVGLSFGDYFRISIAPLLGYSLTPKVSVGGRLLYEYIEDKRYTPTYTTSNYGASVFARYRIVPPLYAHGEVAYMSYGYQTSSTTNEREWIPFILLGGGYVQPVSPKASVFVEVLFDVLQDANSPYGSWDPWVTIGVAAGF